jgi:hypothetical protein
VRPPSTRKIYDPGGTGNEESSGTNVVHVPAYVIKGSKRKIGSVFSATKDIAKIQAHLGASSDVMVEMCADTCARTTGILKESFVLSLPKHLSQLYQPGSKESQAVVLQAFDGKTEAVPDGHIQLPTKIGSRVELIPYLVCKRAANDALNGTGGIDILRLVIDVPDSRVQLKGSSETVPLLVRETQFLCSNGTRDSTRALLVDAVAIPAYSERLVVAAVAGANADLNWTARIEADKTFYAKHGVAAAYGVTELKEGTSKVVLANMTAEAVLLPKGTSVAMLEPMTRFEVNSLKARKSEPEQGRERSPLSIEELEDHRRQVHADLQIDDIELSEIEKLAVREMIDRHILRFYSEKNPVGHTSTAKHQIDTEDALPHREQPRKMAPHKLDVIRSKIEKLKREGTMRESRSPWSAQIVLAPKKQPGQWRFAVDYRKPNDVTKFDSYPMPRADVGLECLRGANWFSTIDLASGFHQVEIVERDKEKTALSNPFGLYEVNGMPFGLSTAPATFQRLMDIVLAGLCWRTCLVYLDDVLIFTRGTLEQHLSDIEEVLERLKEHGLVANPSKCELAKRELTYVGHVVSKEGCKPDPSLTAAIRKYPRPKNLKDLRGFIGLSGFYRAYVKDFARIAAPLTDLTKKDRAFVWAPAQQTAFESLKQKLISSPVLAYPDFEKEFRVKPDWSKKAMGAVLSQIGDDNIERPIAYLSRRCQGKESLYSAGRGEATALWWSVKRWRPFLEGREFVVVSDHLSLAFLRNPTDDEKLQRIIHEMEHFRFRVEHKSGTMHVDADALSRNAPEDEADGEELLEVEDHLVDHILHIEERLVNPLTLLHVEIGAISTSNQWEIICTPEAIREQQAKDEVVNSLRKFVTDNELPKDQTSRSLVSKWGGRMFYDNDRVLKLRDEKGRQRIS